MDTNVSIRDLSFALLNSWDSETAIRNQWDKSTPSINQCVPTSLVVQDYFSGNIVRCPMKQGGSHYWNELNNIGEIDLTFTQFKFIEKDLILLEKSFPTREYLLSFNDTAKRYEILKNRVEEYLNIS